MEIKTVQDLINHLADFSDRIILTNDDGNAQGVFTGDFTVWDSADPESPITINVREMLIMD